jgi:hypothetical protein
MPISVSGKSRKSGFSWADESEKEEYVLVKKERVVPAEVSAGAVATLSVPPPSLLKAKLKTKLKLGRSVKGAGKTPVLKTRLVFTGGNSSAANTALATVVSMLPSSSSEFAGFATLYEECKVTGGRVLFNLTATNVSTAVPTLGVISYDPTVATALASVADGAEDAQHRVFATPPQDGLASLQMTPKAVEALGLMSFAWHVPKGASARTTSSTAVFSGEWSSTADASDLYGYIKVYIPAQGASASSTWNYVVYLDVEFRSRI